MKTLWDLFAAFSFLACCATTFACVASEFGIANVILAGFFWLFFAISCTNIAIAEIRDALLDATRDVRAAHDQEDRAERNRRIAELRARAQVSRAENAAALGQLFGSLSSLLSRSAQWIAGRPSAVDRSIVHLVGADNVLLLRFVQALALLSLLLLLGVGVYFVGSFLVPAIAARSD